MLSRTMHDIRYNPVRDEFVVGNPFANAILTFRGGANGQEPPIRIIQGPKTRLEGPQRFGLDSVRGEILIDGDGGTLVFPVDAQGDVAPKYIIPDGPSDTIEVDSIHNLLVDTQGESLRIWERTGDATVRLRNTIKGPSTGIDTPRIAIYPEGNMIVVGMRGPGVMEPKGIFVGAWSLDDNGDVPPRWKIDKTMKKPFAVALNPQQKEVYVTDMRMNGVLTFYFPEVFETRTGTSALRR
jgi:hypothetical protein